MSDELTRLLTETLHSRENHAKPIPGLTARVVQKGRAARNRRLALGWGTTGLVAAVAFAAVVLGPVGRPLPNPGPANSGVPSPSATSPAPVTETSAGDPLTYAGKLPTGPPIAVIPRTEKRGTAVVVVTADHLVTLPAHTGSARVLTVSAEGLLVSALSAGVIGVPDPNQALYLIRTDGSLTKLHKGPFAGVAVDPTGKELAIAESAGLGSPMGAPVHITIASLSSPGTVVSHTEPSAATSLLGWTSQGLLMSDSVRTWLWQPGAGSETEIPGVDNASVMPTDPDRLLVSVGRPGARFCAHVYTVSSRRMGPALTCDLGNGWTWSPDGRLAVVGSTVVDLASGRTGPELMDKLGSPFGPWEDSTHVLTQVVGSDLQGRSITRIWVRCDVTSGVCEQAPTSALIDG